MREPSLGALRILASVAAAVAAVCLAISVAVLVPTVSGQQDRLAHQSLELECRGDLAAQSDALRNEVSLWLSRAVRAEVRQDRLALSEAVSNLDQLDQRIEEHNAVRERTVEECAEP